MKIRSDLVGSVVLGDVTLRAGDTVPTGLVVGDHLLEKKVTSRAPAAKSAPRAKKTEQVPETKE